MRDQEIAGELSNEARNESRASGSNWWRLPVLLAIVLATIVLARSSQNRERGPLPPDPAAPAPAADPSGQTVSLTIQFGDGQEQRFNALPWHQGMTVDDLMTVASRLPDAFTYTVHGQGEMTMLTMIDQTRNEGAGGRNWTYSVNGQPADRSLAVYELQPGDRVLWTFGPRE